MDPADPDDRHRVVAGLFVRVDTVLLCRRSMERRWYPGVWDLPGGHIEAAESATAALRREMREELGVTVGGHLGGPMARLVTKEPCWSAHDEIGWFPEEEVGRLALADVSYRSLIAKALGTEAS
jgi:8-oxo-dGTP pyrophosphatase MutT (NUDIX family)